MASLMIPPSHMSSSGFWFNPSPKPAVSVAWDPNRNTLPENKSSRCFEKGIRIIHFRFELLIRITDTFIFVPLFRYLVNQYKNFQHLALIRPYLKHADYVIPETIANCNAFDDSTVAQLKSCARINNIPILGKDTKSMSIINIQRARAQSLTH